MGYRWSRFDRFRFYWSWFSSSIRYDWISSQHFQQALNPAVWQDRRALDNQYSFVLYGLASIRSRLGCPGEHSASNSLGSTAFIWIESFLGLDIWCLSWPDFQRNQLLQVLISSSKAVLCIRWVSHSKSAVLTRTCIVWPGCFIRFGLWAEQKKSKGCTGYWACRHFFFCKLAVLDFMPDQFCPLFYSLCFHTVPWSASLISACRRA